MDEPKRTIIQEHVMDALSTHNISIRNKFKNYTNLIGGGGVLCVEDKNISYKKLIAFCAAGLGNRLLTLAGALYWTKKLNLEFNIYWDEGTCCQCSYDQLFNNFHNVVYDTKTFCYLLNTNIKDKSVITTYGSNQIELNTLTNKNIILYNDSILPYYISYNDAKDALSMLSVNNNILYQALSFIKKFNIDKKTIGLHIRKIDPPEQRTGRKFLPLSIYKKIIKKNSDKTFFVCSDNADIEKEFLDYKNVCVFIKKNYPKYDSLKDITYRDSMSVTDSLIDMIILSHTNIHPLCLHLSSFCKTAKCLPSYD